MLHLEILDKSDKTKCLIRDFLIKNEHLLPDPLSIHVNLDDYATKLCTLGINIACIKNDSVLGIACGYINDYKNKNAFLQVLIISEEIQGLGFGSKLVREFIATAKTFYRKNGKVYLTVDKSNKKAIVIYKHIGFKESKIIHKKDNKQIMEYEL